MTSFSQQLPDLLQPSHNYDGKKAEKQSQLLGLTEKKDGKVLGYPLGC